MGPNGIYGDGGKRIAGQKISAIAARKGLRSIMVDLNVGIDALQSGISRTSREDLKNIQLLDMTYRTLRKDAIDEIEGILSEAGQAAFPQARKDMTGPEWVRMSPSLLGALFAVYPRLVMVIAGYPCPAVEDEVLPVCFFRDPGVVLENAGKKFGRLRGLAIRYSDKPIIVDAD